MSGYTETLHHLAEGLLREKGVNPADVEMTEVYLEPDYDLDHGHVETYDLFVFYKPDNGRSDRKSVYREYESLQALITHFLNEVAR